jgi:hypothetical protein
MKLKMTVANVTSGVRSVRSGASRLLQLFWTLVRVLDRFYKEPDSLAMMKAVLTMQWWWLAMQRIFNRFWFANSSGARRRPSLASSSAASRLPPSAGRWRHSKNGCHTLLVLKTRQCVIDSNLRKEKQNYFRNACRNWSRWKRSEAAPSA